MNKDILITCFRISTNFFKHNIRIFSFASPTVEITSSWVSGIGEMFIKLKSTENMLHRLFDLLFRAQWLPGEPSILRDLPMKLQRDINRVDIYKTVVQVKFSQIAKYVPCVWWTRTRNRLSWHSLNIRHPGCSRCYNIIWRQWTPLTMRLMLSSISYIYIYI